VAITKRKTILDSFTPDTNIFCNIKDLYNEASVETFFIDRLIKDLKYEDSQIKTKLNIQAFNIGRGRRKELYKPDYIILKNKIPRFIIDAKSPEENLDKWVEQCSGYCLGLNRKYKNENPVIYFILSNGISTCLYKWDRDDPINTLDFNDFNWGNEKYEIFKRTLASKSILNNVNGKTSIEDDDFELTRPTSEKARHLFSTCHNAIWKSEVCSPSAAFMEFIKIMFVKLWEDRKLRNNKTIQQKLLTDETEIKIPSTSVVFSVRWIEEREAEGAINPIDSILFTRLRDNIEKEIQLRRKKRLFNKDEKIDLRPDTIKDVVKRLEHYDLYGIDEDLNGRLFETFLSATMRGRALGQFFTPRSIVKMMTYLSDPKVTSDVQNKIIDGCCGTGGFLIEALTVMRNKVRNNISYSDLQKEKLNDIISNEAIFGIDLGKDPPLARIARINMYLHGDGGSRIYYADSLNKDFNKQHSEDPEVIQNLMELKDFIKNGELFDIVLTNPPFSMKKETKNDTECEILKQYEISRKSKKTTELRPSLRSSILFIERYWELLKPGGKLLTVIDDTLLSSTMFKFVRNYIRDKFIIRAIISLPGDAFRVSGSRVKTSVLFLEKKIQNEKQPPVFTYFSEFIGVDDLSPRASKHEINKARMKAEKEINDIISKYNYYLEGNFIENVMSPNRIQDRLDLKYCVPLFGRKEDLWKKNNVKVKKLSECVKLELNEINPKENGDKEYILIKVTYDGICEIDKKIIGKNIKPNEMYVIKEGQIVFSTIRATDGAMGIVPKKLDGALVSGSYLVFNCGPPEDTAYLWSVLRTHEIRADMQSISAGTSRYSTTWPDVGEVLIPWMDKEYRHQIGQKLIRSWELQKEIEKIQNETIKMLDPLDLQSEDSKHRWRVSKAPT